MTDKRPKPVVLCVLDGWGWREGGEDNAVARANTPSFDRLWQSCPHGFLKTGEEDVGLPAGQMGNSEVGHMNLGAGRVVFQDLPMIDRAIAAGDLKTNKVLSDFIAALKKSGGTCHLMGLASPGGVHSHEKHMIELAREVAGAGVPVAVHAFLDGRDVPPRNALSTIPPLAERMAAIPGVRVATLCGRYYAMDRDKRWDRVEKAYAMLTDGDAQLANDVAAAIKASYKADKGDEFMLPAKIGDYSGMKNGDGLLMANFRADRVRQILASLLDPAFDGFTRKHIVKFAAAAGMVEYSSALNKFLPAIFPPKSIKDGMGEIVSRAGMKQLRIAETEKYAHVTYFFNGGEEVVYPGEERIMVPSPKVATYDLQPEMSAAEVTDKVVGAIDAGRFDFIVINFANPDMVGHTGDIEAAIRAVEAVDRGLGAIADAVTRAGGALFATADHGNCEMMFDTGTKGPHTAHTLNPVPAILLGAPAGVKKLQNGRLADVAPTLLEIMGLPRPPVMDGKSLLA
ncbi:MAG: 2,3-bisphosphoglycerate-independent phosphoglycerate mutase [Alphaproteobacteria bacterium]|nr:2,3-bisphosphoglycerate-independent phosphoglycerate mutase [Alphaproteobacteria bacterium]